MSKCTRAAILSLVAALLLLIGCGGTRSSAPAPAPAPDAAPAPAPAAPAKPVTISFWHGMSGPQGEALKKIVGDFNVKYQGKIVVEEFLKGNYSELNQALLAAVTARTTPTIAQLTDDMGAQMVSSKALASFQKYIDSDAELKASLGNISPAFLKVGQFDGQQYLIPFNRSVQVLFVNTDVVKGKIETVDDFQRIGKEVSQGKLKGTAFNPTVDYFDIFFRLAGGEWFDAAGKSAINSAAGQRALQLIVDMYKDGSAVILEPKTYQSDYFNRGDVAMFAGTSASMGFIDQGSTGKRHWTVYPLPRDKALVSPSFGTSVSLFADARPEEQKAAATFVGYLTSPEAMAYWAVKTGYLPINKKAVEVKDWVDFTTKTPAQAVPATVMDGVVFQPAHPRWSAARPIIDKAVQLAVREGKPVKEALDEAARSVDEAMARK